VVIATDVQPLDTQRCHPTEPTGRAAGATLDRLRGLAAEPLERRLATARSIRPAEGIVTATEDITQLVQDYGRAWDADAPRDLVDHNPQPGQGQGREGIHQVIDLYHATFPDLRITNEDVVVSGDRGVLRWSATGTHEGDQLGVPATHRNVRLTGIDILRIEDGRIVERWAEFNALEMMQQIS
jgi:predicted ester cyclase